MEHDLFIQKVADALELVREAVALSNGNSMLETIEELLEEFTEVNA